MQTRRHNYVTVTTDVEVDIADFLSDDDELSDLGLHRDEDCGGAPHSAASELLTALTALHQQAHPDQPLFPDMCLREPCRSLSLRDFPQLGGGR